MWSIVGAPVLGAEAPASGAVLVDAGVVAGVGCRPEGRVLRADGLVIAPGFVDLQVNGGRGIDLTRDPERLWDLAAQLPSQGVTAFLPTVITAPLDAYDRALSVLAAGPPPGWIGATPVGWHFEGPMLNAARRGAHPLAHLQSPSPEVYAAWSRDAGVAMVTIAPELAGALDAVAHLVDRGVRVAAGHTAATTSEIDAARAAGVVALTHLFNAMTPFAHREPGPVGAALAGRPDASGRRLVAGLIVDGIHVHPIAVAAAWAALGPSRTCLVTDAVAATGLPPGRTRLGDAEITLGPEGVRNADGTLAGADLSMDRAVANLVAFTGCSRADAVTAASTTPARLMGLTGKGTVRVGGDADLVLLRPDGTVAATVVGGQVAHASQDVSWRS
jgi:N-acetylglucosamine-6-phosphate deacetylase